MHQALYFDWAVSTLFGWGVYGLNLLRHWSDVAGTAAYTLAPIKLDSLAGMDPLGLRAIAQKLVDSDELQRSHITGQGKATPLDGVVLHALGNGFCGSPRPREGGRTGHVTAGVIFFEDSNLPNATAVAAEYHLLVTGSSWCQKVLHDRGVHNVATVFQGIDPSLFHPAPRAGTLDGRFAVFSGGKLERRKGQDLVLLAFRAFATRHPEAVLVTSWHSPWPAAALTLNSHSTISPVRLSADGRVDPTAWAVANGIRPDQFIDLGVVPNHLMARVIQEMDVAIFPNRCEGGTNLVAMECMACGIPSIVANNTGQCDLVATGAPYALTQQRPVASTDRGTEDWGECDIDDMLEALEHVHAHRDEARRRGSAGAQAMAAWTWQRQVGRLYETLSSALDTGASA